jgi:hypothetical protein
MGGGVARENGPQVGNRMTGEAGRRQGGDFLPLNRLEKKDAIFPTGSVVLGLSAI